MSLTITVTNAGRAALVNAQNTGTAPVTIASVGLSQTAHVAAVTDTALPDELKRVATVSGQTVADDTIHLTMNDTSADAYALRSFGVYLADGTLFAIYGQADPVLNKVAASIAALSVDIIFADIDATSLTFGNADFSNPPASETVQGIVLLASEAEVETGTDTAKAITPAGAKAVYAPIALVEDLRGSYKGKLDITANTEVTVDELGNIFEIHPAGVSIALPDEPDSIGKAVSFFSSYQTGYSTLTAANFNSAYGSNVNAIKIPPGASITLVYDGTSWDAVGGSGAMGAGYYNNKTDIYASTSLLYGQAGGLFEVHAASIDVNLPDPSLNIGRPFTFYSSFPSGTYNLKATSINSAYGNGASVQIPAGCSITVVSDGTAYDAVGGSGAMGLPVKPQSASGVGQWQLPIIAGTTLSLPAGGTWAYAMANNGYGYTGIGAGGSVIFSGTLNQAFGHCWRIL